MNAASATRATAAPPAACQEDAVEVIAGLLLVMIGDGKKDHGQMSHRTAGGWHLESCQRGMCIQAGDSLRGGQPCSKRCQTAQIAAEFAVAWLLANRTDERPQPEQRDLFHLEEAVAG